VATLPAPANGILYLFGDGSHADKRGTTNPVAQKGRISKHHPWFFGLRFVLFGSVHMTQDTCGKQFLPSRF
jgi:hypothetical protein